MASFSFADEDRERWAEQAGVAVSTAATQVRDKIAKNLTGNLPRRARGVFRDAWWQNALDEHVGPVFTDIAVEAADGFADGTGLPVDVKARGLVAGTLAATAIGLLASRGDVVRDRVASLHKEGRAEGWNGERLAKELGLDGATSGPLSDLLAEGMGRSLTTGIVEGTAVTTAATVKDTTVQKVWRCSFVERSRPEHEEADGQTVGLDETFDIGGYPALWPGDDQLPVDMAVNCLCYLEYEVVEAVADQEGEEAVAASAAHTFAFDPGQVTVTVEPTAAEKQALAAFADVTAELHVPLLQIGDLATLTPDDRMGISTALATVAASLPPLSGTIEGVGWLADRGVTVGIVDCPGLMGLYHALCEALMLWQPEPREYLPVIVLTGGSIDASAIAGTPVHFNELRLRFGSETLVFDLLGPLPTGPDSELAPSEIPPAEPAPVDSAPQEAPVSTTTTTAAEVRYVTTTGAALADMPPGDTPPTDAPPSGAPSDLAGASDDDLVTEVARRAAERAAADGAGTVDELLPVAEEEVRGLIEEVVTELEDETAAPPDDAPAPPATYAAGATDSTDLLPDDPYPAEPSTEQVDGRGIMALEGIPTSDGRMFAEGAVTWRNLPLSLMLQTVTAPGHDGAVVCGAIVEVARVGNTITYGFRLSSTEAGQLARTLIEEGAIKGISVDVASAVVVYTDPDGSPLTEEEVMFGEGPVLAVFVEAELMAATLTPFPAFADTSVVLLDAAEALVASGPVYRWNGPALLATEDNTAALVASAAPTVPAPPAELFGLKPDTQQPFTTGAPLPDGTVPCYGLLARWGTCHIGFDGRCVTPPRDDDFAAFYTGKKVLTREGRLIPTGPLFMDTVHPDLRRQASDAQAFYADTGCAVADVRLYNGEHGIVAAGVLRPDVDQLRARRLRSSDVSPDWRAINGRLRMVALLAVNASGFNVPLVEGIAASAGRLRPWALFDAQDQPLAVVAAGAVHREPTLKATTEAAFDAAARIATLETQIEELWAFVNREDPRVELTADERAKRAQTALASMGLAPECVECH